MNRYFLLSIFLILLTSSFCKVKKHIMRVTSDECLSKIEKAYSQINIQVKSLKHVKMLVINEKKKCNKENIPFAQECVNSLVMDEVITLVKPVEATQDGDEFKQWQLKRTNVIDLPLPNTFERRIKCEQTKAKKLMF